MLMYHIERVLERIRTEAYFRISARRSRPVDLVDDVDEWTKVSIRKHVQGSILIQEATISVTNDFHANRGSPQPWLFPFPITTTFCRQWESHRQWDYFEMTDNNRENPR